MDVDVRDVVEKVVRKHGLKVKRDHLERVIAEIKRLGVVDRYDVENLAVSYLDVGESYFFRDRETWENLPRCIESMKRVRFLSLGCSEGEEVYTFSFVASKLGVKYTSLGADVHGERIKKAKRGIYERRKLRLMRQDEIDEYFDRVGSNYRVKDEYRVGVEFKRMNIVEDFPPGRYDVVFIRRVLIYFEHEKIVSVLENVEKSLADDGILVLGKGELYRELFDLFEPVLLNGSVFWRKKKGKSDVFLEIKRVVKESFDFERFLKKLMNVGMYANIVEITKELIEEGFENPTIWKYHLYALVYSGENELAKEELDDALKKFPDDPDLLRLEKVIS